MAARCASEAFQYAHNTLGQSSCDMGKVESTSDSQSTSASLDGASNTLFWKKITSHMQKHFHRYQSEPTVVQQKLGLQWWDVKPDLTFGKEIHPVPRPRTRMSSKHPSYPRPRGSKSIFQHNISTFLSGWLWLNMTPFPLFVTKV